ncbi:PREDICTED: nucleoplasmin ATPase-like isoform X4 [Gavialis gangeticus]|uniref:nucleoplasmin ATPase-like isoform X4 n=1 Tax=Gavialis gangeticus TaxID=94835 RepID=UPI00092F0204|nr:PREDICTED: nucleoplasmin ATPase-like isoform X4 [Gavialis gangeticus]
MRSLSVPNTQTCKKTGFAQGFPLYVAWVCLGKEHPHVLSCVSLGCELNASTRKYIVKEEDDFLEHLVSLKTICLGAEAKDELNVVAVAAKNTYGDNTPMPIASLKLSVLPMATLDGFEFTPPVDFVLKSGTGPVYLHGQHVILKDYEEYDATCEGLEKEEEETEAEMEEKEKSVVEEEGAASC